MSRKLFAGNITHTDFGASLRAAAPAASLAALYLLVYSFFPALRTFLGTGGYTQYFYSFTDPLLSPYTALLLIGALTAYPPFRFLYSAPLTNVVFSRGLSRAQLFLHRFAAGAGTLMLSVFVPLTATLLVNLRYGGTAGDTVKTYLLFLISALALVLTGFSVGLLAVVLSGTVYKAAALAVILLYFPSVLLIYVTQCFASFIKGYDVYGSFFQGGDTATSFISPPNMLDGTGAAGEQTSLWEKYASLPTGTDGFADAPAFKQFLPLLFWIAVSLLLAGVALALFTRRKAEINGRKTGMKAAAAVMTSFAVLLPFIGKMFKYQYDADNGAGYDAYRELSLFDKTLFWCDKLVPSLIVLFVCLFILTRNSEKFLKRLKLAPLVLLLTALPCLFLFGFFGAASRIPAPDDVKSVGIDGFLDFAGFPVYANNTLTGFSSDKDKALVAALQKALIETKDTDREVPLRLIYKLKNGNTVTRYYGACSAESLRALAALFDSDVCETYFHNQFGDKSTWESEKATQKKLDDNRHLTLSAKKPLWAQWLCYGEAKVTLRSEFSVKETSVTDVLNEKEFDTLLSCYAEDLVGLTASEYATPSEPPVGILTFRLPDDDEIGYRTSYTYYIGASMKKTRAFLKAHGLDAALLRNDNIEQIIFEKNCYGSDTPFAYALYAETEYNVRTVTGPSEIQTVMKTLYPYYLITEGPVTTATVEYTNGEYDSFVVVDK